MLILLTYWEVAVRLHGEGRPVGHLLTPRTRHPLEDAGADGLWWAADNDAFAGFREDRFLRMLSRLQERPRCLWVAAPDAVTQTPDGPVGDAAATLDLFDRWEPVLRSYGFPVALVAQDGLESLAVPWERLDCLFLGGSTAWKEGEAAEMLAREAKRRRKWVHVGRVSTHRRIRKVQTHYLADSIDSTAFARWCDKLLPRALEVVTERQLRLEFT